LKIDPYYHVTSPAHLNATAPNAQYAK